MERKAFSFFDIADRKIAFLQHVLRKDEYSMHERAVREEKECLLERGYSQHSVYMNELKDIIQNNGRVISRICVSVTNQCTLKCEKCNALMPICEKKYFAEITKIIAQINKITSCLDLIVNLEIIGGESLLHKDLPRLIENVTENDKIQWVEITTNGTVMPSEELVNQIQNPKVVLKISNYGKLNSKKVRDIIRNGREKGYKCIVLKNWDWLDSGGVECRNRNKWHLMYDYFHCDARKDCRILYNGKLFVCGRAPILHEIGKIIGSEVDWVDIENASECELWGKIRKFYSMKYAYSCNYCDYAEDDVRLIKSGVQKPKI